LDPQRDNAKTLRYSVKVCASLCAGLLDSCRERHTAAFLRQ